MISILKKIFPLSFLLCGFLSLSFYNLDEEECEDEDFLDECAEVIEGYKFLKANKIFVSGGKGGENPSVEFSSVFSKGSTYMLTACNASEGDMIVTLFDRNRKKIMSSFNKDANKFYPAVSYQCMATGVYYLKYEFQNSNEGCGVGILGFKK